VNFKQWIDFCLPVYNALQLFYYDSATALQYIGLEIHSRIYSFSLHNLMVVS
jgi:hypothetical protein